MRRLLPMIALITALVAACGSGRTVTVTAGGHSPSSTTSSSATTTQPVSCPSSEIAWIDAERNLDARLDVGMTEANYGSAVASVNVKLHAIPNHSVPSGNCWQGFKHAQAAEQAYIAAYNKWNHCITDFNCSVSTVKPYLQARWAKASRAVATAVKEAHA